MSKNYKPPKDLLYPLQYDTDTRYETGFCADGRQVVMGLICPHLVAYFFDPQGILLGKESRLWEYPARSFGIGCYDTSDKTFIAAMDRQITAFQEEIGFRPDTIRVRHFFNEQNYIGIQILPDQYTNIETNEYLDEEEKQEFLESRDAWLERGDFVWLWDVEYWIDAEGRLISIEDV